MDNRSKNLIFASIIYTFSVWQKNVKVYKILGIISGLVNIVYFSFIGSIFGIILETIVCLITIVFTVLYIVNERKEKLSQIENEKETQKAEI